MKCIVFSVLLCVITIQAKPYGLGLGELGANIGRGIGAGIGTGIGTGFDLGYGGAGLLEEGALGLGLGTAGLGTGFVNGVGAGLGTGLGLGGGVSGQSGYAQGGQFGGNRVNAGASGIGNQGFLSRGNGGFHNDGQHHSKVTSINQAEESEGHSVGGGQASSNIGQSGNGFNNYLGRANNFGSQFGQGGASQQGLFI